MKAFRGYVQGYNAQLVTSRGQLIVAAEIAPDGLDASQLDPMISTAERELEQAGVTDGPEVVVGDAGHWSNEHIDRLRGRGIVPLIADAHKRDGPRPGRRGGPYDFMRRALASERAQELFSKRRETIEPVFGQVAVGSAGGAWTVRRVLARLVWFPPAADIEPCMRFSRTRLPDVLRRWAFSVPVAMAGWVVARRWFR